MAKVQKQAPPLFRKVSAERAAVQQLVNPIPLFLDSRGALLDAGKIYVGTAGQDPEDNPIAVYWDTDLTELADQPLRTLGGVIVNGRDSAFVYFASGDYSLRVKDADDVTVTSLASVEDATEGGGGGSYQPLSANLTALAAIAATSYGRNLLALANQAALKAATGIPDALPLTGGTVTGNIIRGAAGAHTYHANALMTSGRIFLTADDAADPTSLPGDIWLTYPA